MYKDSLKSPAAWILAIGFAVSFITLVIYFAETDFSDDTLFLLLQILRYSSFLVFICSVYKLLLNFYRTIIKRKKKYIKNLIIYFFLMVYGIIIFLTEAFIVVITGGNV